MSETPNPAEITAEMIQAAQDTLAAPNKGERYLYQLSDDELSAHGFRRDQQGRIQDANDMLVCAVSGRRHRGYLLRIPFGVTSFGRPVWVSKYTLTGEAREMIRATLAHALNSAAAKAFG